VRHGRASGWNAKGEGIFEIVHADGSITKGPNTNYKFADLKRGYGASNVNVIAPGRAG